MEEADTALEQFRQQWRDEVNARSRQRGRGVQSALSRPSQPAQDVSDTVKEPEAPPLSQLPVRSRENDEIVIDEEGRPSVVERIERLRMQDVDDDEFAAEGFLKEPSSALEHYERAVEKESQGSLGASLSLYRKAYRLDARVDQSYVKKHFPAQLKPQYASPSNASATVPSTAHHSLKKLNAGLSISELIASFVGSRINGADPLIDGDISPPCPISKVPEEVLGEILLQTAVLDPAAFARLALVCKKLAYHVSTENSIWKRVALGYEFGFAGQQYDFATDLHGSETIERPLHVERPLPLVTEASFTDPQNQDWREIFHSHPRIRFTGVYISTVNYARPGSAAASQTWNSPIHIITYYRYLRFFRDGTVISLLSTSEPIEVVHHLTKENIELVRINSREQHPLNLIPNVPFAPGANPTQTAPPSAQNIMKHALWGRWRLSHPSRDSERPFGGMAVSETDDNLHIETEGASPHYMYMMHLSLKSGSRSKHSVKNNKLVWNSFWSHNQLTNDWAQFQLKNDKPFFFSRVRSYGLGY